MIETSHIYVMNLSNATPFKLLSRVTYAPYQFLIPPPFKNKAL